jgi:CheY-like chemotaxis protein
LIRLAVWLASTTAVTGGRSELRGRDQGMVEGFVGQPQSILIVDDDPAVLSLFAQILKRGGFDVLTADTGKRALEILRSQTVRLMVLDISMPEPDGFELLKFIRTHAPGLRVLAVSGYMGGALLEASSLLGATDTLEKTKAPEELLDKVRNLMKW